MEPTELIPLGCLTEDSIQAFHNRGCASSRMVALQHRSPQRRSDELFRRQEHPRLRAPKSVDRLLWVAYDKHRRPTKTTPYTRITAQPSRQRTPLQGARVLELIDQNVPNPRVQPLLHPT